MAHIESILTNFISLLRDILQNYRLNHLNRKIANNQDLQTLGEHPKFKNI